MKELKNYIHLYLGCDILVEKSNYHFVHSLSIYVGDVKKMTAELLYNLSVGSGIIIKPILRPLSDLTEYEAYEYACITFPSIKRNQVSLKGCIKEINNGLKAEEVRYLLSKHFDLFNLIAEGLALDKNTTT